MKILLMVLSLASWNAFAWGPTGHRVVGEIAERFLEVESLVKVRKLIGGQSLAQVATWPDEIRSDPTTYSYTFNWHFTEWPDDMPELDEEHASGSLLKSIQEQLRILKDPIATPEQKAFALKFIVHLVGDLHMPLHVGNGTDTGGNDCKVRFMGKVTNLHRVWDEDMIDFTRLSFTEISKFVSQKMDLKKIRAWKEGSFLDWARESRELRSRLYPKEVVPQPAGAKQLYYCRKDIQLTPEDMPNIGYDYSYQLMPMVEERLFQAGLRLGHILNQNL